MMRRRVKEKRNEYVVEVDINLIKIDSKNSLDAIAL